VAPLSAIQDPEFLTAAHWASCWILVSKSVIVDGWSKKQITKYRNIKSMKYVL
jgi:hypothetical protein